MVGDPVSSSSEGSSTIHTALDNWVTVGQPCLNRLLTAIQQDGMIQDPTLQILIFQVVGAYTYEFSKFYNITDRPDISTSHTLALSRVMSHPAVSKLVDRFMNDMVSTQVKEMV